MKYGIVFAVMFLVIAFSGSSCKSKKHGSSDGQDSTKGFISSVFFSDNQPSTDVITDPSPQVTPPGDWSQPLNVSDIEFYQRSDNSPDEFAKSVLFQAIRMVYTDEFHSPKAKVVSAIENAGRYTINIKVSWGDRWVSTPYVMDGILEVNTDGSDANFKITNTNTQVEALEFTNEGYRTSKQFTSL